MLHSFLTVHHFISGLHFLKANIFLHLIGLDSFNFIQLSQMFIFSISFDPCSIAYFKFNLRNLISLLHEQFVKVINIIVSIVVTFVSQAAFGIFFFFKRVDILDKYSIISAKNIRNFFDFVHN